MFVVVKDKESGELSIYTRAARETMINTHIELGLEISSMVLGSFDTYSEANQYKKSLEDGDEIINKVIL